MENRGFDLKATDRYLRTRQAAAYIGVAESTLLSWRRERRGPPAIRLSVNRCAYDVRSLDAWMASRVDAA
jgi:predicted DNA-binding transcriptional regulator AlpA